MNEQTIFTAAVERLPAERAAFLDEACGTDHRLRERVEKLIALHEQAGNFLEPAAGDLPATLDQPILERPGTQIGPYKLLQQIGEGGMGTVYMAEQSHPVQRKVALKVIKPGMDSGQVIARFEAERQALALMDHPHIAKVLDAGTTEVGRPYFVMELVKGVPITTYCDENHLPPKARLELFTQVCQAVQHAHHKGVIHRDLKPSNVLVTLYDDKPVPKVIDFGVAKATGGRLTERTMFTGYGQIVGTLEYMSPEQARLNALDVDTRGDIYSLGVLLYELLTGTTPFDKQRLREAAFDEMLRMIREEEPPRPSTRLSTSEGRASIAANRSMEPNKLSGLVRGELDWIVMKALEKDRNRRYETANGFAMDIQRYLQDEHVLACPPSAGYRLRKFARRNKAALATASLISTAMVAAVVILALSNVWVRQERNQKAQALLDKEAALVKEGAALSKAREQEDLAKKNAVEAKSQQGIAEKESSRAKDQEHLARRRYYSAQMNLAQQAWEAGNPGRVLELLESQRPRFDEEDPRSFDWYYLWRLCHVNHRLTLRAGRCAAFSPDGKTIATSARHMVKLWDASTGQERGSLRGSGGGFMFLEYSPDGKLLAQATGPSGKETTIWNTETGQVEAVLEGAGSTCVTFSADGKLLATGARRAEGSVKLWEVGTWRLRATLSDCGGNDRTLCLDFSPDSKLLATSTGWSHTGGRVTLWDLTSDPPQEERRLPFAAGVVFSPDGKSLATNAYRITLWDVASGKEVSKAPVGCQQNNCLAFSPDGQMLVFGSDHRRLTAWEPATGKVRTFPHLGVVHTVAFSPDGASLVSASGDGTAKVWNLAPKQEPMVLSRDAPLQLGWGGTPIAFSPDGNSLSASTSDGTVTLWDLDTGKQRNTLRGPGGGNGAVAFSRDGKTLAAARNEWDTKIAGEAKLWDLRTGQELAAPGGHTVQPWCVAFSHDGKTFATGAMDGLKLWDAATRQPRHTIQPRENLVQAIVFAPDGATLAVAFQWGVIHLYDTLTGGEKCTYREQVGTFGNVVGLAFTPDGTGLATGDENGNVRLRDAVTGHLRTSFKGHTHRINSLAFFPDGKTLASGSSDDSVKLWDVATGQERLTMKGGKYLAVSRDGKALAVGGQTVTLRRAATEREAVAYKTELDPDDPESPVALNDAGDRLWVHGQFQEAEEAYRNALSRLEKLAAQNPKDPEYRAEQACSYFALSLVLQAAGRSEEADQSQRQGLVIHRKLATDYPDALDMLAVPLDRLVVLRSLLGTTAQAGSQEKQIGHLVLAIHDTVPSAAVSNYALALNNQAWRLATGAEPGARDPKRAVELARKAMELDPKNAAYANTLGVALYRSAEWKAASVSLQKSMDLRNGGDSFDWFFLAMAQWQLGKKDEACKSYEQAALWMAKNNPANEELNRFRDEAAELLRDSAGFSQLLETLERTNRAEALAQSYAGSAHENLAARRQAIDLLKELLAARPDGVQIRGMLAATLQSMGEIQTGLQEFSDAETSLNEALRIRRELQDQQQDASQALLDVVSVQVALGQLYWVSDRRPLAQATWQECLSVLNQLAEANRTDPRLLQAKIEQQPNAGLFRQWLEIQRAEADWHRKVQLAGNDPMPWIQRGRFYAERGEHKKADADFTKAASLTPDELNKFLAAGWWVVGPYPAELREFCPPEIDPDPSKPVHVIDPQTGLSNEPVRWQNVATEESAPVAQDGTVDLTKFLGRTGSGSIYALGYIFSPDERSVTLHLNKHWPCRVWINGASAEPASADAVGWLAWTRVPVVLRPGRNTILVKTASQRFMALLSDAPAARAWELFKFGDFDRAVKAYARVLQDPAHEIWIVRHACFAALVTGDQEAYRAFSKHLPTYSNLALDAELDAERDILDAEVYASTDVAEADLPRLKKILERWYDSPNRKREPWFDRMLAWSHYRLGEFDKVVAILNDHPNEPHASPVLAMAYHRLGQQDLARQWLARADAVVDQRLKDFAGNGQEGLWLIYPTYREAVELIRGDALALDVRFDEFLAQRRRLWEARDLLVSAFDDAISNAPYDPHTYLARGRRLAELGRFDDAEADFNKTVELKPGDVELLVARARFYDQRSDVDRARTDFDAALKLALTGKSSISVAAVEHELGRHDAVLVAWQKLDSGVALLWRIRAERQLWLGNWKAAADLFSQGDPHWYNEKFRAALCCLFDDAPGYQHACQRHLELSSDAIADPAKRNHPRLHMLTLRPTAREQAAEFERLLDEALKAPPDAEWVRFPAAIALYRQERHSEALAMLDEIFAGGGWQYQAQAWPLLAIIHWKLGHHEEARLWLARTAWWIDLTNRAAKGPQSLGTPNPSPYVWLVTHVFYREAKALIEGDSSGDTPDKDSKP